MSEPRRFSDSLRRHEAREIVCSALVALSALLPAGPRRVAAQSVSAGRALDLGSLLPGVSTTVQPSDPSRSGRVDISGNSGATIEIRFTLPTTMIEPSGATVPISFGSASAAYSRGTSGTITSLFDPRAPYRTTLSTSLLGLLLGGNGSVFLGATVLPSGSQRAGAYSATVSVSVAYTSL